MTDEDDDGPEYLFIRPVLNTSGVRGGLHMRSMGLGRFIKECEDKGFVIVAIRLDQSNNCEFLFIPPEENHDSET